MVYFLSWDLFSVLVALQGLPGYWAFAVDFDSAFTGLALSLRYFQWTILYESMIFSCIASTPLHDYSLF